MEIAEFLQRASARPWCWGEHDCTLFAADWVLERRGLDPARGWRHTYSSAPACERKLRRAGGLEHIWTEALTTIPLAPTSAPMEGDVGLVLRRTADMAWRATGAIRSGAAWATLTPDGLLISDAPMQAAWRL